MWDDYQRKASIEIIDGAIFVELPRFSTGKEHDLKNRIKKD